MSGDRPRTEDSEFARTYLEETVRIARGVDREAVCRAIGLLRSLRESRGRLFVLGVGGSAGNASHAVNDFRKIAGIEAYAPTDNVSELTAWTNDVGWDVVFERWLRTSNLSARDAILVLSVGGGAATTSRNLVLAMEHAKEVGARVLAVVSRDGGRALEFGDAVVLVPVVSEERITPHAEGWQAVIWHLLVNALG